MNEREVEFRRLCAESSIEVDAERDGRFWRRVEVFKVPWSGS